MMSDLLKNALDNVVLAKKQVCFVGGQARLQRAWDKYNALKAAIQKEQATGHAEDIPPERE